MASSGIVISIFAFFGYAHLGADELKSYSFRSPSQCGGLFDVASKGAVLFNSDLKRARWALALCRKREVVGLDLLER